MSAEQRGLTLKAISALDFSGGSQSKTSPALSANNQLLHLLNGDIDKKLGAIVGRCGSAVKNATAKVVVALKVFWNGSTKKYLVIASDGANEVVYSVPNSDFSGTLTAILSGHFANSIDVHTETFAKKEFFFNGVTAPKQYNGTAFSAVTNAPTTGKFPRVYNQRLYVLGIDGFLYYSDVINSTGDDFTSTTWTSRGINPNDGQIPKALIRHRGRLVIFKTESIYRFNGSNEPEATINVGTHSERGVVQNDTDTYFHYKTFIYKMSLGNPSVISRPVEKYLRGMSTANWANVSAGKDGKNIFFWIGDVTIADPWEWDYGKTYSNVTLVYNPLLNRWMVFTGWDARLWYLNEDDGKQYFATNSGDITYVDPTRYDDNGSAIDFEVMPHPIHYGYPHLRKTVDRIVVYGTPDLHLHAGSHHAKMEAEGTQQRDGSVQIRKAIDFNSLWVFVNEAYKDTPPVLELLHIGRADLRNEA